MTSPTRSPLISVLRAIHFPAMFAMSRLRYATKFTLIAIVLLLPPLVVAYQQYQAATHQMRFNDGEVLGMIYMEPLHDLLDAQERHWVASVGRATGHKEMAAAEAASEARAAQMLAALDQVNATYRNDDRFELFVGDGNDRVYKRLQDVKAEWGKVLDATKKGVPADIHAAHASAMAVSSDFVVNYISNYSNLILDPDLDSYWLMDIAIAKGPTMGIDLATATATALMGETGDKTEWVYGITGSLTDANGIVGYMDTINLATAISTSKDYGNNAKVAMLKAPYDELKTATIGLTDVIKGSHIRNVVNPPAAVPGATGVVEKGIDMAPLLASSMALFDKLDKLYDDNNVPLRELCERRVGIYKGERRSGVLFTLLAILLHFWVFAAFYFNINDSIGALAVATTQMVKGTNQKFTTTSKDEISDIVGDFNEINSALVEARELQGRIAEENAQTQANIVDLLQVVSDASDGNLTVRAQTSVGSLGNVADAFNLLMESLERLVGEEGRVGLNRRVASYSDAGAKSWS